MQASAWYSIAMLGAFTLLLLRRTYDRLPSISKRVVGRFKNRTFLSRGRWSAFTVTLLDVAVLVAFLGGNALLAAVTLRRGLAHVAIVNLVPLFLGGRTNFLLDFLGIPLHVHQLAHHWLGRVAVLQATLHGIVNLPHLSGPSKTVAIGTIVLMATISLSSLLPVRRWKPALFRWVHISLALLVLGGVTLHIILATTKVLSFASVLCLAAALLILTSWSVQLGRRWVYMKAELTLFDPAGDAMRLWVRSRHQVKAYPGTYFYLSFSSLPLRYRYQSYLVPVAFWSPTSRDSMTEFSFLINGKLSESLRQHFTRHQTLQIGLDGPYGHRIRFGDYDLVILVADGRGIVGVLPFVLSILSRNKQDREDKEHGLKSSLYCDKTRKVDLIWKLDNNAQVEWAAPYFAALSEMEVDVAQGKRRKKVSRVRPYRTFMMTS